MQGHESDASLSTGADLLPVLPKEESVNAVMTRITGFYKAGCEPDSSTADCEDAPRTFNQVSRHSLPRLFHMLRFIACRCEPESATCKDTLATHPDTKHEIPCADD